MSDKPKVYQGVRVKTTVKELLQRHRAREANSRKVKMISQACLDLQDLCASTFPGRHADPPYAGPAAASFPLRADPLPSSGGSCSIPLQDSALNDIQQQFGDMMLPSNGYSGPNYTGGGCYSTPLSSPASLPAPWCHGLSSDADYYGPGLAPCSSTESLKLCQPVDHSSYSPHDSFSSSSSSFSSSSSSCYDSPTRMESNFHGFPSEHFNYQHCNLQDCYCLAHWPGQQGGPSGPEYGPYSSPSDYPYACPVEEGYLKRELQMSSEMCYNIL